MSLYTTADADAIASAIETACAPLLKRICDLECAHIVLADKALIDGGIWQEGIAYAKNSLVTYKSTIWCAVRDVAPGLRPGMSDGWQLRVKHHHGH